MPPESAVDEREPERRLVPATDRDGVRTKSSQLTEDATADHEPPAAAPQLGPRKDVMVEPPLVAMQLVERASRVAFREEEHA